MGFYNWTLSGRCWTSINTPFLWLLMNRKTGGEKSLNPLLVLSHTLLNWQIVMWVALPQIPSGLYLFTFPSLHFPNQALERSLISLDGLPWSSCGWDGWCLRPFSPIGRLATLKTVGSHHTIASNWQNSRSWATPFSGLPSIFPSLPRLDKSVLLSDSSFFSCSKNTSDCAVQYTCSAFWSNRAGCFGRLHRNMSAHLGWINRTTLWLPGTPGGPDLHTF